MWSRNEFSQRGSGERVIMSNFRKRAKSMKRTHRERGQPLDRTHLGLLEKHKDYVLRARDYQRKKEQVKVLHEKARNRNPDEFYYKMVHTQLKEGRHMVPHSVEQAILRTQDLKYVEMKLASERKKVERLQASLHLLGNSAAGSGRTHTFFVDSQDQGFDPAKQLNTDCKLTSTHSRPTQDQLSSLPPGSSNTAMSRAAYRELVQRTNRTHELQRMAAKMRTKRLVAEAKPALRIPGSSDGTPATYRWRRERKK